VRSRYKRRLIQLNLNKSGLHELEWKTRDPYSLVNDSRITRTHCISHALKPVPKTMWERRKLSSRSQSLSDDRYGSSRGTPKKRGCECEKRLIARGSRDISEALRPVSSSAIAVATMIQMINTVHSN